MILFSQLAGLVLFGQEGTAMPLQWRLRWNWDWPLWATFLAILLSIAWVTAIYVHETSTARRGMRFLLSSLRLVALLLALLMFAQPAVEWFRLGQPRLVLLVDRSASMGTLDRSPGTKVEVSRLASGQEFLTDGKQPLIEKWQSDYQLEVIAFDERIERLSDSELPIIKQLNAIHAAGIPASQAGTRLGDAVDYALRELPGEPPVAIIVLSDGIATQGQTLALAAERARRLRVPLYTVAVGSERRRPDIALENMLVEGIVFPGDHLQVEATVRATSYEGQSVNVILRNAASNETAARVLARTTLQLPADDTPQTVHLTFRPSEPGELALELFIEPQDEEINIDNNVVRQVVKVSDKKIRVLLVQSEPSYEYRSLKSLLERDPAVDLRVVLQEADADYPAVDETALRGFPVSEQELFAYDVLLLGDVDPGLLPRSVWPLVERFVTVHGGGMVGIAGPRFMPFAFRGIRSLEMLLPMPLDSLNPLRSHISGEGNFSVVPTALGWQTPSLQLGRTLDDSQQIWQALPSVSWMLRIDEVKPGVQLLAGALELPNSQGKSQPVILRHYVGAGEVLFHATDETWRWRWRTDDRYFARYWGQVVRRLGRSRLAKGQRGVQLTADRTLYEPGEAVQLQVRFRNPAQAPAADGEVVVQLQRATGPPRQLSLQRRLGRRGLFSVTLEDLVPGEYELLLVQSDLEGSAKTARFEIRQPPRELANVVVNRQGLSEASVMSGGKSYTLANASELTKELPLPRKQTLAELPPRQLWNSHAIMALFVIVLTSEWIVRRRYGML